MRGILKIAMARLSAPTIGQLVTSGIISNSKKYTDKIRSEYKKRSAVVLAELKKIPGISYNQPAGAFYQVIKLPVRNAEDFIRFFAEGLQLSGSNSPYLAHGRFLFDGWLGSTRNQVGLCLGTQKIKSRGENFGVGIAGIFKKDLRFMI
jgi:aspartate aminotransferase